MGLNLFAYCLNNPVNYSDYSGENAAAAWLGSMWWLTLVDGPVPIGDIIYALGAVVIGSLAVATFADADSAPVLSKKKPKGESKKPPDVDFPKDGPKVAPGEGYEWRGKKPVGGDKGAWVNPSTGEQWHPDLNHPDPKGPHWDYTDIFGIIWSVFEDGRILIWEG